MFVFLVGFGAGYLALWHYMGRSGVVDVAVSHNQYFKQDLYGDLCKRLIYDAAAKKADAPCQAKNAL